MIIKNKTAIENWAMAQLMCIRNEMDIYYLDVPKKLYQLEDDEYDIGCLPFEHWENGELLFVGISIKVEVYCKEDDTSFSYYKKLRPKVSAQNFE